MNKLVLAGCAWLMVAGGAIGKDAADIAGKADAYLRAKTEAGAFSGTVLLARGGKTLFVGGYGYANEEWRIPNNADTRFPIASITKTFTATLILKLRQRGQLALTDPVCKFVSPCPESWRAINLGHLLLQTTGIPDYAKERGFLEKVRRRVSLAELIAQFRDRPLEFKPGAKHAYSNSNYILLGAVLEKASGKSYETLLRELIFQPLGMRHSGLDDNSLVLANRASGYSPAVKGKANAQFVDSSWLYSAGGIYSTVGDLLIWERALQSESVLSREDLARMWSPAHGSYGYGWQLMAASPQWLNRRLVFHAGGITGFASDLLIYPDEQVTVIVLANLLPIPLADIARDLSAMALD
jgi:CubicO group peptidase (beta-lactamase class C family)